MFKDSKLFISVLNKSMAIFSLRALGVSGG
jgi:hypothetical protein